jgi:hypothetical protein
MSRIRAALLIAVFALGVAGCSQNSAPTRQLTERQRDSTLANAPIPGAPAVGYALKASDKAAAAAKQLDADVQAADEH